MSAVSQISDTYDYSSRSLEDERLVRGRMPADPDRKWGRRTDRAYVQHHLALVQAMEPAQWPKRPSRAHQSSLTAEEAEFIRTWYAQGKATQTEIAESFDVSIRLVSELVNGLIYKDVGGPITHRGAGNPPPNRRSA